MASSFNHILASFSPLRGRLKENVSGNDSESDGGGGSVAVAPGAAVGAEEGAAGMGGGDDENNRESSLDDIEAGAMDTTQPTSARSAGGRGLKRQRVLGGNEIPLNITHLGVLTRASKLNMNDDELFDYFFARLQGNEMPMACASMECECLSILGDDQVSKAVASYLKKIQA